MSLYLDSAVGSCGLSTHPALSDIAKVINLDYADAFFVGNGPSGSLLLGIEIKELGDLVNSTASHRLQSRQIPGMVETYDISFLLHYTYYRRNTRAPEEQAGQIEILNGTPYSPRWSPPPFACEHSKTRMLDSALILFSAAGVHIKGVYDLDSAAEWLRLLYNWWTKPWESHKGFAAFDGTPDRLLKRASSADPWGLIPKLDKRTSQLASLIARIPLVGAERAIEAARYFGGSPAKLFASTPEDWLAIPIPDTMKQRIGRSSALKIVEWLRS